MLTDRRTAHAIVVLLDDDADADALARMLGDLSADEAHTVVCLPPVRGLAFFADTTVQRQLDAWWAARIPAASTPVFVVDHHHDLPQWLVGLDASCYVGVRSETEASAYEGTEARVVYVRSPLDYAAVLMNDLVESGAYGQTEARRMRSLAASIPDREAATLAPVSREGRIDAGVGPDPFDLLIAMSAADRDATPASPRVFASEVGDAPASARRGLRLPAWTRRVAALGKRDDVADRDLATTLVSRGSTIVAVGSRKGGVGKTSHAAGVAIVAGAALDSVGRCAAIVDANIANPDAWGQLNLPPGAATVRDVIAALAVNHDPPRPVHASTPALACFPESREASEYSRTEIGIFVAHLRARYPLVVVDMSNRLPDPTAGPEAAAAAYWLEHADVLVLPSAASKQDFNGVLDYLEVRDIPPAIVASLVPRTRRNREHPLAKRYMAAIAQRAYRVVDIPDEAERVRYAGMEGVPVETVSSALKAAYRELAEAIAAAPRPEHQ